MATALWSGCEGLAVLGEIVVIVTVGVVVVTRAVAAFAITLSFSSFAQVRFSSAPNPNVFSWRQLQTRMFRVYCRQGVIENAGAERMGREGWR